MQIQKTGLVKKPVHKPCFNSVLSTLVEGLSHLMCVRGVVSDVDLQSAGFTDPSGWESVQILWRVHSSAHRLLLAVTHKY